VGIVSRSQAGSGALTQLASTVLGASAPSIDFSGIAATLTHLLIVYYLRSDAATTNDNLLIRFNNDSGANYDMQADRAFAATPAANEALAATSINCTSCLCGANAPANVFAGGTIEIHNYANASNNKTASVVGGSKGGTTTGTLIASRIAGFWRSSAAINRVTLLPATGNFVTGSLATLYGLA
jgi:hypothetical protein